MSSQWVGISGARSQFWGWWVCPEGWVCQGDGYSPPRAAISKEVGIHPCLIHGTWDTTGYGRQAGGMHPTRMLSCFVFFLNVFFSLSKLPDALSFGPRMDGHVMLFLKIKFHGHWCFCTRKATREETNYYSPLLHFFFCKTRSFFTQLV